MNFEQAVKEWRENRLKRAVVVAALVLLLVPSLISLLLLYRIGRLEDTLETLTMRLKAAEIGQRELSRAIDRMYAEQAAQELVVTIGEAEAVLLDEPGAVDAPGELGPGEALEKPGSEEAPEELGAGGSPEELGAGDPPEELGPGGVQEESEPGDSQEEPVETVAAHRVYLTFDDGPSRYTQDILDILDAYDVKATFFVVGRDDEASLETLQEIVDRGHTLGMHSYSHRYADIYASVDAFVEDVTRLHDLLERETGVDCCFYRFPGGSSNTVSSVDMQELIGWLDENGIIYFDWNISSGDAVSTPLSVEELVRNCVTDVEGYETSVILLHDLAEKRTTVEALPQIIEMILAMDDTELLPITEETTPIQHIKGR